MRKLVTFFSLFGSVSTLFCCALPVLMVSVGLGASFASLTAAFPQIIWVAEHKNPIFLGTALLLVLSYFMMMQSEKLSCPTDTDQKEVCSSNRSVSKNVFWASVFLYSIAFLFSFILPLFL